MKQIFYGDVKENIEIPELIKDVTFIQLVKWAGAVDDYYPIHIDKDFARNAGFPDVFAHGWLTSSFIVQMITDWIGDLGDLKKMRCRFHDNVFPGHEVICKGRVTKKYINDNEGYIECEVWIENYRKEKVISGFAVVTLPIRT